MILLNPKQARQTRITFPLPPKRNIIKMETQKPTEVTRTLPSGIAALEFGPEICGEPAAFTTYCSVEFSYLRFLGPLEPKTTGSNPDVRTKH
ncbi:MAG: hypothetical protein ABIK28_20400 [Planctomycetota bacterium]